MKSETREIIDKEPDACEGILKNIQELGKTILGSMVLGWKNDLSDDVVQPDWEKRLRADRIAYSTKDLDFAGKLHSNILCFEAHRSNWQDGLKHVDRYIEGMQYKTRHLPMPQFTMLFQLCIRFQEYVHEERAVGRDIWKEYLHGEDQFLVKGYEAGKEKVLS